MGKYGIGERVRHIYGEEGVVTGKAKWLRLVRFDGDEEGVWVKKQHLTPIAANYEPAKRQIEVGDRVRCTRDHDPGNQFTADKEYTVRYVTNESIGVVADDNGTQNGWASEYFELVTEPATHEWKPKVGDRVRVVKHRNWFGDVLNYIEPGSEVELTGLLDGGDFEVPEGETWTAFTTNTQYWIRSDDLEPLPVAAEEQGAGGLRIVVGRYYRTRDGRKVGPMRDYGHSTNLSGPVSGDDYNRCYNPDGTHEFGETNIDLVAEWAGPEPVAVASATATPAGKFKVGDRVRVKGSDNLVGVVATRSARGTMSVRWDVSGSESIAWWDDDDLEPADTPVSAAGTADTPTSTITAGSLVTLGTPAIVTGIDRSHAHLQLASGGSYTLPVAALVPAA